MDFSIFDFEASIVADRDLKKKKKKKRIANSVDPDEMVPYEPSHLDLHSLQRTMFWSTGINKLNTHLEKSPAEISFQYHLTRQIFYLKFFCCCFFSVVSESRTIQCGKWAKNGSFFLFIFFLQKIQFDIPCELLPRENIRMKYGALFLEKKMFSNFCQLILNCRLRV